MNFISSINTGTYEFGSVDCTEGGSIDITQQGIVNSFTNAVSGVIQSALMENQQINAAITKLENDQKSKNTGIGDAILKALSGFGMVLIAIPLLIIAAIIVMKMMSGGKKPNKNNFKI